MLNQHISSRNIIQFDPLVVHDLKAQHLQTANNKKHKGTGSVGPLEIPTGIDVEQNECGFILPCTPVSEITSDFEHLSVAPTNRLREADAVDDSDDADAVWDVLYKATSHSQASEDYPRRQARNGQAGEDFKKSRCGYQGRDHIGTSCTKSKTPVLAKLEKQRETYRKQAEALRKEMEVVRKQLDSVRKIIPRQPHSLQDNGEAWRKIGNVEFAHPFSAEDNTESDDDFFVLRSENFFDKDWSFSFHSHEGWEEIERSRRCQSSANAVVHDDFTGSKDTEPQKAGMESVLTAPTMSSEKESDSLIQQNACEKESQDQGVITVSNITDREPNESCANFSVDPIFKHGTVEEERIESMEKLAEPSTDSEPTKLHCDMRQDEEWASFEMDSEGREQPGDDSQDPRTATKHRKDESCNYHFQPQHLEVIHEVDEGDEATTGDYSKDMETVQKLLQKYRKRGGPLNKVPQKSHLKHEAPPVQIKVPRKKQQSRQTSTAKTKVPDKVNSSRASHSSKDKPFAEIENVEAVILYREAKDPDSWFDRHANLIQGKEEKEKVRCSLTVELSPPGSQASLEREAKGEKGEQPDIVDPNSKLKVAQNEYAGETKNDAEQAVSKKDKVQTRKPSVGKISRNTLKQWENKNW